MALTLTDREILDLSTSTLNQLRKGRLVQFAQKLQHYEVMSRIIRSDRVVFQGGKGIQQRVMTDHSDAATDVGFFEEDTVQIKDTLSFVDVPWRHTQTHYAWDRREMLENDGESEIVDLLRVRRTDGFLSLAAHMEDKFWDTSPDAADQKSIFPIGYWLPKPTTGQEGFVANLPTGFTDIGGLDPAVKTGWQHYAADYAAVSKTDLIAKVRKGVELTQFKSPVGVDDFRMGIGQTNRWYCNIDTRLAIDTIGESQNENLGRDVASMDGITTLKGAAVIHVPKLNTDAEEPLYGINLDFFYPVFLRGNFMRETDPAIVPSMHNAFVVWVDLSWNIYCDDRRRQQVYAKVT